MNKAQLIDALAQKLGDKRTAGAAVDGIVDVIVRAVHQGERVNITGFGVFEKRARAARMARNPRTGEAVRVKKTTVPAFRAGTNFREVVSGAKKLPKATAASRMTAGTTARAAAAATRATGATASTASAKTTTPAKATVGSTAAKSAGTKSTAKSAAAKTTTAAKSGAKSAAKAAAKTAAKTVAKATAPARSTGKKATAKKK